jgi:hypothetical protein
MRWWLGDVVERDERRGAGPWKEEERGKKNRRESSYDET